MDDHRIRRDTPIKNMKNVIGLRATTSNPKFSYERERGGSKTFNTVNINLSSSLPCPAKNRAISPSSDLTVWKSIIDRFEKGIGLEKLYGRAD